MKRKIEVLIVVALLLALAFVFGCKDKVEGANWMFIGTFCPKCNYLYDYTEYPKICVKCGKRTKDFYYLCKIEER